jgi:NADP-dependent 3-hydroxy acid dehydrogenase YdfG
LGRALFQKPVDLFGTEAGRLHDRVVPTISDAAGEPGEQLSRGNFMNLGTTSLSDRVIIVTGASAGIGRATAQRLADRGAKVIACARDERRLQHLAAGNPNIEVRTCDVTSSADRVALVDGVLARHGRIDALVNNAGVGWEGLVEEMETGDIERLVNTNVTAVLDLTRLVLPGMLERGSGHVVMTSSSAAWISFPPLTVYSATKYAVDGFVEGLRREVWRRGVVVSSVNPGPVATEWLARSQGYEPNDGDSEVRRNPGVPPEWVAAAIERSLRRPYGRTAGVPRVMGLARLAAVQPLRTVADVVFGATADSLSSFAKRLTAETTPVDPTQGEYHHTGAQ